MPTFHTICKVSELPEGTSKVASVGNRLVAIFRHRGEYFAIDDVCPHMGASLGEGEVHEGIVTCPWHAWRFRLADGAWADNPRIKIRTYTVRVEGEELQVEMQ